MSTNIAVEPIADRTMAVISARLAMVVPGDARRAPLVRSPRNPFD